MDTHHRAIEDSGHHEGGDRPESRSAASDAQATGSGNRVSEARLNEMDKALNAAIEQARNVC